MTYTYDSLNRLASATSSLNPGWGQAFSYDGFGNLTQQSVTKGTAPAMSASYDAATNRRTGECADLNGNLCGPQGFTYSYDVENRLVRVLPTELPTTAEYSYGPGNKRVWRGTWDGEGQVVTDEVTFWGVNGQKLRTYQLSKYDYPQYSQPPELSAQVTGTYEYFGGKLIKNATGYVTPDRLGAIGKYFPYGQERPSATADGKEKFGTYFRDSQTGLDYAQNRYHKPGEGRFLTRDPSMQSVNLRDPASWNRYAYVQGDPVNNNDPTGLILGVPPGDEYKFCWSNPDHPECMSIGLGCGILYDCPGPPPEPFPELSDSVLPFLHDLQATGLISGWGAGFDDTGGAFIAIFNLNQGTQQGARIATQIARACASDPALCAVGGVVLNGAAAFAVTVLLIEKIIAGEGMDDPGGQTLGGKPYRSPQQLEAECTPVGSPVIVPSTRRGNKGGTSWEQEYDCNGERWTIHRLYDKYGRLLEEHSRPGGPQYGNG